MLNKRIEQAFNDQINAELYSSYLYLSMSAYFESVDLPGFAQWMKCQAQEELVHAMKFFDFIHERGGAASLKPIDGPPTKWDSPLHAFQAAYAHEQHVTALIGKLVDLALEEKDHASNAFLQWFVTEQVEEESTADRVVKTIALAGTQGGGVFMVDRELGARVFAYPAATGE